METLIIGITIQDIAVTIIKKMDISYRTTLEHILVVTTRDGWVKPHVLVVWRLFTSINIVQQGQRNKVVNLIKAKEKKMLKMLEMRWIIQGRKRMVAAHQMEKGSLHPIGQVITPHQTKKLRSMWDWYIKVILYISSKGFSTEKIT